MKIRNLVASAFAVAILSVASTPAEAIVLDYSNVTSATIAFDGAGNFSFVDAPSGYDFNITSAGAANGLMGNIGGTFAIGAITTSSGVSSASVTGAGTLSIFDGTDTLTAALSWVNILQVGTTGSLNTTGTVNLSSFLYSGSNSDLLALTSAGSGVTTASFTFTPAKTLETLKTTAASTSFSGTISSVPDGGATLSMMGATLLGLGILRRKYRG